MWSNLMQNDLTSIKIEYLKALGCDEIKHSKTTLLEHLMGVRDILQEQGAPEYVQDAGLFHSVYGTTYFKPQVTQNRLIVRELIGEQAEELVWIFCKMPAPRGPKFHEWEDSVIKSNLILIEEANRQEMQSRKESDMYDWKEYYNDV